MKKIYFKEQQNEMLLLKRFQEHRFSIKNAKIVVAIEDCYIEIGSIEEGVISLNDKNIEKYELEEEANFIMR